jgi:hypothetical protein
VRQGVETGWGRLARRAITAVGGAVDQRRWWLHTVEVADVADVVARPAVTRGSSRPEPLDAACPPVCRVLLSDDAGRRVLVTVAFRPPSTGRELGADPPLPPLPAPLTLTGDPVAAAVGVDVRPVDVTRTWLRVRAELPDRILAHGAALLAATDHLPAIRCAGCETTLTLHRGFRADDWMLHERLTTRTARVRSPSGRHVATVTGPDAERVPDT